MVMLKAAVGVSRRDRRLQRVGGAIDEESQRALDRRLAAGARDVGGHRPMREAREARLVEAGEQEPGIAVAEIDLAPRRIGQARQQLLGQAARAIAAAREPQRIEARIVRDLEEGAARAVVVAGEMAGRQKALRREVQFGRGASDRAPAPGAGPRRRPPASSREPGATMPIRTLSSCFPHRVLAHLFRDDAFACGGTVRDCSFRRCSEAGTISSAASAAAACCRWR